MSGTFYKFNTSLKNNAIETSFGAYTVNTLAKWRDKADPGSAEAWGRRFAIIIPMALLGLIGLIDSVASFLLGLLASPAELCGIQLSRWLIARSLAGIAIAALSLTLFQYANLTKNKLAT